MDYTINTKCVQAGYTPGNGEPRQIPIIQSTTYKYDTSEDMGKLFDLEAEGYFYSRLQNPTNDYVAITTKKEGGSYSGTGDLFASVLCADMVKGRDIALSVQKAVNFLAKGIHDAVKEGTDRNEGICFETYLYELADRRR